MLQPVLSQCPACGATDRREHVRFPQIVFARCCGCGSIYRADEDAEAFGDDEYGADYYGGTMRYDRRFEHRVRRASGEILLAFEAGGGRDGRVLDVGCSLGYALEAARRLGFEAAGIDVSEYAVNECRRRGLAAHEADIAATGFADGHFQMALLKHVLEHTPTPRRSLTEMARVLRPGGGMFIAVPHAGYWKAAVFRRTYRWFRPDLIGRQHYVYFAGHALRRLLVEAGFEDVQFGRARHLLAAVASGRRGRFAEGLRFAAACLLQPLRHGALAKELVATARRRAD